MKKIFLMYCLLTACVCVGVGMCLCVYFFVCELLFACYWIAWLCMCVLLSVRVMFASVCVFYFLCRCYVRVMFASVCVLLYVHVLCVCVLFASVCVCDLLPVYMLFGYVVFGVCIYV